MDETQEEEKVKSKGGRPPKRYKRTKRPPKLSRRKHRKVSLAVKKSYEDPARLERARINMVKTRAARQGVRLGVPDGWTKGTADMQRVYDGLRADLLIDRMKEEGMVDETKPGDFEIVTVKIGDKDVQVKVPLTEAGMAEAALREAVIGALSPLTYSKDKLGHIRTVLEYTKKKPATDSNLNVNSEEWLDAALKDNAGSGN
jgi:hypothetical protein